MFLLCLKPINSHSLPLGLIPNSLAQPQRQLGENPIYLPISLSDSPPYSLFVFQPYSMVYLQYPTSTKLFQAPARSTLFPHFVLINSFLYGCPSMIISSSLDALPSEYPYHTELASVIVFSTANCVEDSSLFVLCPH